MHSNSLLMIVLTVIHLSLTCTVEETYAATIAHWRFEEGSADTAASGTGTVLDSSGNDLHGTPCLDVNLACTTTNGPIYRGNVAANPVPHTGAGNNLSLDFNGTDERVFIPDHPMFELSQSLTLEAWINVRSVPDDSGFPPRTAAQIIMRGDNRSALDPYYLALGPANGEPNRGMSVTFFIQDETNALSWINAVLPNLNEWIHVAGTLDDATGNQRLYFNGTVVAEDVTSIRPMALLDPNWVPGLGIGALQAAHRLYKQYYDGLIDEVRISDVALDPSEFLRVAPGSSPGFTWTQDKLGDWANGSNWSPAGGPPTETAIFSDTASITGPTNVSTAAPVTVNRIEFSNTTHSFLIGGFGSVNMATTTTPMPEDPSMSVQGTHQFQAAVNLVNDTAVDVASDSTLTFNETLNLMSHTLTKTVAGTMAIRNDLVLGGGTVQIQQGTLLGNGTIGGNVSNDGGTISPGNSLDGSLSGVPEPSSMLLLALGGLGWALGIHRLRARLPVV